jgi:hypothetical protein
MGRPSLGPPRLVLLTASGRGDRDSDNDGLGADDAHGASSCHFNLLSQVFCLREGLFRYSQGLRYSQFSAEGLTNLRTCRSTRFSGSTFFIRLFLSSYALAYSYMSGVAHFPPVPFELVFLLAYAPVLALVTMAAAARVEMVLRAAFP